MLTDPPAPSGQALRERLQSDLAGAYTIERELGGGGMSRVFVALEPALGRRVVVKTLSPEQAAGLDGERFRREIALAAQLQHPNIVPVFAAGSAGGVPYYAMPLVEGETLRDRLARGAPMPADEVVSVLRDVAKALGHAHAKGVVHRDVKPENILLTGGAAVVADFGIAKALAHARAPAGARVEAYTLTQLGTSLGTPAYMAPEQAAGDPNVDHRADLYALGCVAYEMLAGAPPFAGRLPQALLAAHVLEPPPPLAERRPDAPPALEALVMRCLAKDPAERPREASAVLAALDAVAAGAASASAVARDPRPSIAVLPFANLSSAADDAYFADGLTEEVIADLSQVRALRVISRTSVLQYKGTTKDVRTIGRELGTRYLLEGSVRRAGSSLRITAQLIDAETDAHLWAEKYTGTLDDVFEMQERLSRRIVDALRVTLSPAEDQRLGTRPITDVHAYEWYLRARQEMVRGTPESLRRAEALIAEGRARTGDNVLLTALEGMVCVFYIIWRISPDPELLDRADACAARVLAADPELPQAHHLLGLIAYGRNAMLTAARHQARAVELAPSNPDALWFHAVHYAWAGDSAAARAVAERLRAVDPLTPSHFNLYGYIELLDGRLRESVAMYREWAARDPEAPFARCMLANGLARDDRAEEALAVLEAAEPLFAGHPIVMVAARCLEHALHGDADAVRAAITDDVAALLRTDESLPWLLGSALALAGDAERAIDWLETAMGRGFWHHEFVARRDPFLAGLRGHPRFEALVAEMKRRSEAFRI